MMPWWLVTWITIDFVYWCVRDGKEQKVGSS